MKYICTKDVENLNTLYFPEGKVFDVDKIYINDVNKFIIYHDVANLKFYTMREERFVQHFKPSFIFGR